MLKTKKLVHPYLCTLLLLSNLYADDLKKLESVTVTAQKSEENIQKVPLSISVFNEEKLKENSISTLEDIASYTPNLLLFDSGEQGLVTPSIRGISGNISSFSTPISLYVDGVPTMNSFGYTNALLDIDRIEVLKGPQGTLYGKNSEVGVINIITKKPNNITKGKVYTKIGSDGKREFGFNVSGPIIKDKFYAGASYKQDEKDGFITNTNTNNKENSREGKYGKINFRYTPTDDLDISFIASKSKRDDGTLNWAYNGQSDNIQTSSNLIGYSKPKEQTYALNIDYNISKNTKLTSTTTKRKYEELTASDMDGTAATIVHINKDYKFDTISQEFKLQNNIGNAKLVSGIYFSKDDYDLYYNMKTKLKPSGVGSQKDLNSKTYSAYTNLDIPIYKKFRLNAGIRYDYEKKEIDINENDINLKKNFHDISPKLSFLYDIDELSTAYFTVAKGYKSGGFNPFAQAGISNTFNEEELLSYELGYKAYLFDDSVLFNTAIYYMDIDDMHIQLNDSTGNPYISNAAKAKSKGLEVEIQAYLNDEFTLFASGAINHTTFDDYSDSTGNHDGNYNPFAPKYNFNLGVKYKNEDGIFGKVDLNGYGKTYFDAANKYYQKAYELVNMKVGYEEKNYEISLYGKNIFNKEHNATNAYLSGTRTVYYDDQEFGFEFIYKF